MSTALWIAALACMALGAALVLIEAHDLYRAREFWRAARFGQHAAVPDFWDSRYVTAELTIWTPKVIGGALLGLVGLGLAAAGVLGRKGARG